MFGCFKWGQAKLHVTMMVHLKHHTHPPPTILQCSLGESPSIREKGKNVGQGCVATKACP